MAQRMRVAANGRESAERRQQSFAIGRQLVVVDDGDSLAKPLFELRRLPDAREISGAGFLEARDALAAGRLAGQAEGVSRRQRASARCEQRPDGGARLADDPYQPEVVVCEVLAVAVPDV